MALYNIPLNAHFVFSLVCSIMTGYHSNFWIQHLSWFLLLWKYQHKNGWKLQICGKLLPCAAHWRVKKKKVWAGWDFRGGIRNLSTPVFLDWRWLPSSKAIQHLQAVIISLTFLRPINGKWESLCQNTPLQGLVPACLPASIPLLRPSRSLSLPPRWSSQRGWMRLIFNSSCANGSLARCECSMHSNLSHHLIYSPSLASLSLAPKKEAGGGGALFVKRCTYFFKDLFRFSLAGGLQRLGSAYGKRGLLLQFIGGSNLANSI